MIPEKLLDFKYYYNKLPLYLQQSEGFESHFEYWIELLQGIDSYADKIESMLDIFNADYLELNPDCGNFLEKLGLLYGVSRVITISGNVVTLNNKLLLLLIRMQIVKNYFNGTWDDLYNFYFNVAKLPITYRTNGTLSVQIYFVSTSSLGYSDEELSIIFSLLQNGYLYIESLGVKYDVQQITFDNLGFWDVSEWDDVEWGV